MIKLIIRVLLTAVAFFFILPLISGISFHGNFVEAIGIGALFAVMTWVVGKAIGMASTVFAVGTLGLGLLILIPLFLFGFWLVPALVLKLTASIAPAYLTVSGWGPAIWGGLVLLVVNMLTHSRSSSTSDSSNK